MLRRLRSHLTYANVMATIAVFLVLSGGAAVALKGSNHRVRQGGCAPTMRGTGAMVKVGSFCIDKYEASVWSSPKGGTQYGVSSDDYPCNDNGQNCSNIYARSVPGVKPARYITWFQAQQALANSGKRLPSNAEWQEAVRGTPDAGPDNGTTDCNTLCTSADSVSASNNTRPASVSHSTTAAP